MNDGYGPIAAPHAGDVRARHNAEAKATEVTENLCELVGEDEYRITIAIAGFAPFDVNLEVKGNALSVTGKKTDKPETKTEYLHQGIAGRSFERRFQLADHVEVTGADLNQGLLQISLKRTIPEALKSRTVAIRSANELKTLEAKKAA